jgi:Asp-tRNA(Asn)/Glu-tRNA(Gln) amidotransferase A subunit family amidase
VATLTDLRDELSTRRVSAVEATQRSLEAIDAAGELRAFLTVGDEQALAAAAAADRAAARGEPLGPLHGVPFAVKDLQETAGMATSYGVRALRDHVPAADAVIVERLRAAGAILVGKTNTPAFGALGETKNRLGPQCRNPRAPSRSPGGSSGGSAAAVAAGLVPLATGTDSAGSIACPAAFCGIVGLKPTRGRVPCWPAPDDSLLLNHTGPMGGSVADVALALSVVAGPDPRDPQSVRCPAPTAAPAPASERPLAGVRIAYSRDLGHFAVDDGVAAAVELAALRLGDLGAVVEEAHPDVEHPLDVYMPLYATDFRRSLAGLDAAVVDELFGETRQELREHPSMSAEQYAGALYRLWRFDAAVTRFFERFDLLITPATGCVAFGLGEPPTRIGGRDVPYGWQGFMAFQVPWNLTGNPSISLPCGTSDGLPVGMLLAGRFGDDAGILRAARAFQDAWPDAGGAR